MKKQTGDKKALSSFGNKGLAVGGMITTVGYLAFIGWYWSGQWSLLLELKPNEFGDFLAGVFAPLAFLWLVLGFIQQGVELRHSADALWLQGEELRNSVEQQKGLVSVTQEQLALEKSILHEKQNELERSSQPILELLSIGQQWPSDGQATFKFSISNHGPACTDVRISWLEDGVIVRAGALETGAFYHFQRVMHLASDEDFHLVISYIDSRSYRKSKKYSVIKKRTDFEFTEIVS